MSALDVGAAMPRRKIEILPALTPLDRRRRRRALDRLAVHLPDADRRGPRHGHDDLHHGLGAHPRVRHDGRTQLRPWRLHRPRRLCRDARASAARKLVERGFGLRSTCAVFTLAVIAAALVSGALGFVFERLIVKPVYGQHLRQILATIGGSIIAEQLLYALFGPDQIPLSLPKTFEGSFVFGEAVMEKYRRAGDAGRPCGFVAEMLILNRTKIGLLIRAGVENREMVEALGYRIDRLFVGVFMAGSALAGLGGAMMALYRGQVQRRDRRRVSRPRASSSSSSGASARSAAASLRRSSSPSSQTMPVFSRRSSRSSRTYLRWSSYCSGDRAASIR